MKVKVMLTAVILMVLASCSLAADWPQFLGPNRDGTSEQTGILRSWPDGGPNVEWTVSVGPGYGSPVVKDGKVYLLDRDEQVGDDLRCFDLATGTQLWNYAYDAAARIDHPGSRSIPSIDGDYIYSCGALGDLYCININTHQPVWHKNIWTDFGGGNVPRWAITQNPLVYGDLLIVASQAPDAGVVAYDKLTGDVKWKTPALGGAGYVSPSIVKVDGQDHLVMITASAGRSGGSGKVAGMNPLTGEILWEYSNYSCMIPIPHAVDAGDNKVLITGGYNAGAAMIQIEQNQEGEYSAVELFKTVEFGSHTLPPILYNDYFYVQYSTNERNDGLVCMSMDGEIMWKTGRSPAFNKGGMILADGLLLALDGSTTLYLVEPDPSEFKPLASAVMLKSGENWAPLVLVDGKLFIRDQSEMKCVTVAN